MIDPHPMPTIDTPDALIPAALRARLKDLRLVARHPSTAHGFGLQSSRNRGAGMEFAQYRAYEPGDEPRLIDWKLLARSDRYYVREAERDSPLTVWLLIDATASMGQSDRARPGWSRLSAAAVLAACVLELALRQGDRFGLAIIDGDGVRLTTAGAGARHRDRCVLELQRLRARGAWPAPAQWAPLWQYIAANALVLMLSDSFDPAFAAVAERLAAARREVVSLQLLTAEERDFPFHGGCVFRDPETGAELRADGEAVRAEFLERFNAARAELSARLASAGIRHLEYVIDEPLVLPLQRLFGRTQGQSGS